MRDRTSFTSFAQALQRDLEQNPAAWEHTDLPSYLGALHTWLEDMGDVLGEAEAASLSWRDLARLLLAARGYE